MVQKLKVEGFEAFKAEVDKLSADKSKTIFVLFSGTKDADGKEKILRYLSVSSIFCYFFQAKVGAQIALQQSR